MYSKEIALMRKNYRVYLTARAKQTWQGRGWMQYCSDCPANKCVLCVEEKKYLKELIDDTNK